MLISCGPVFLFTRFDFRTVHQWTVIHLSSYSNLCSHDSSPCADQNTLLTLTIFPFTKSFMPLQSGTESMMFASSTKRCLLGQNDLRSLFVGHDLEYSGDLMFAKARYVSKVSKLSWIGTKICSVSMPICYTFALLHSWKHVPRAKLRNSFPPVCWAFATRNDKEK